MPAGRPSKYTEKLAAEICERLIEGESLRRICRDSGMPTASTVCKWLVEKPDFSEQYAKARDAQAETLADEIVDIADGEHKDSDPARDRLRVDARKWVAAKLKPKKYGDRQLLGSDPDNPLPAGVTVTFRNTDAGGNRAS